MEDQEPHVFKKFEVWFWEASLSNYVSSRVWPEAISDTTKLGSFA